jgi:RNA polymerase sigma-70 factor (ECF subfamily)
LPEQGSGGFLSGDVETAAAELRAMAVSVLRSTCRGWLLNDVDDLAQDATMRVLARIRVTEGKVEFTPGYVRFVLHSVLVDEIRRHRRRREDTIDDQRLATRSDSPYRYEAWEIKKAVDACLAGLIEARRRAVWLYLQGHRAAEAAKQLGCDLKKVRNLTFRGLANLRACLAARGVTL